MGLMIPGGGRRGRGGFGVAHHLLLIRVSWLSFSSVEGLKCYFCEGDDKCMVEKECGSGFDTCLKITGELNGQKAVAKGCAMGKKEGCEEGEALGIQGTVCNCKGNLCNGDSGGNAGGGGSGVADGKSNSSTKKYSPSLMILLPASTLTVLVTKFGVLRGSINFKWLDVPSHRTVNSTSNSQQQALHNKKV